VPSVDANVFSSRRKLIAEVAKRAPALSAASFAASSSATLSATGMVNGSTLMGLFHSPLGVYISHTHMLRNTVCVHFNIAPEDLDFTLHTLIATMSEATIGTITRIVR